MNWLQYQDKALGALRLAVADDQHLRDVLRMSEDPKRPERKIQFFVVLGTFTRAYSSGHDPYRRSG
ncbi:hypothetical protein ACNKHO_05950 [Shigella flexneri]